MKFLILYQIYNILVVENSSFAYPEFCRFPYGAVEATVVWSPDPAGQFWLSCKRGAQSRNLRRILRSS